MKVVFIGASKFGMRCLQTIIPMPDISLVGVISNEQHFTISYAPEGVDNVNYSDITAFGKKLGIPVYLMKNQMKEEELIRFVEELKPDLFLVVGWYHLIPASIRAIAPAWGLHASLLPDYSGGAPLVWAIIKGEKKTGITLFEMDDGVDSGAIIGQAEELISYDDNIATLYHRIEEKGVLLLQKYIPLLAGNALTKYLQDESCRRVFPQRSPADGEVDWSENSYSVYNFIRAQTRPYPGAFTLYTDKKLIIWSAKEVFVDAHAGTRSGTIMQESEKLLVNCGDNGIIELLEIEYEGKRMTGDKFKKSCVKNVFTFGSSS